MIPGRATVAFTAESLYGQVYNAFVQTKYLSLETSFTLTSGLNSAQRYSGVRDRPPGTVLWDPELRGKPLWVAVTRAAGALHLA